jgi:hypothetical protein
MNGRKRFLSTIATVFLLAAPWGIIAQQNDAEQKPTSPPPQMISITELLPETLAGAKATSEIRHYTPETLLELVADKAAVYQEYNITEAASRRYGATRVDVCKTASPRAAFGLFTYTAKVDPNKALWKEPGAASTEVADGFVFWKQSYFVKVSNALPGGKNSSAHAGIAKAVAHLIPASEEIPGPPALFDSLPKNSLVAYSERYFLGPEALNAYLARGRDRFSFDGKAEAVVAEYRKASEAPNHLNQKADKGATKPTASSKPKASPGSVSSHPAAALSQPMQLVIIEYHTPQFCTDAMKRLNGFEATLSEDERQRFIIKRVGNFIVGATNFEDREFAEALLNTVEYPYVVKWLQNPAIPTNDPFAIQKAGQMLVSTFSLIGLSGGIMLLSGAIFGTTLFLKRRKQQREAFSDAGGMIGLHLDPLEEAMLSLPAAKDEE